MAHMRTYRDQTTGVVREYPPALAEAFPQLVLVEPGTKPLAYVPIPPDAVKEYKASVQKPDEEIDASDKEDEEGD